jgi:uncharacterized protein YceK
LNPVNVRTRTRLLRKALLAALVGCATAGSLRAEPTRAYPPTYSSSKMPWYDPAGWFTGKKSETAAKTVSETKPAEPPAPSAIPAPPVSGVGNAHIPAWKWYGYGAPTPGNNPYAPSGIYAVVPGNWYPSTGTTPGAIPLPYVNPARLVDLPGSSNPVKVADASIRIPEGPNGPTLNPPESTNAVAWQPSAKIGLPLGTDPTPNVDAAPPISNSPLATLKLPLRDDGPAIPATSATPLTAPFTAPATTAPAAPPAVEESVSPDLPVQAAEGIVIPGNNPAQPITPPLSRAPLFDGSVTARGRLEEGQTAELPAPITQVLKRLCPPGVAHTATRSGPQSLKLRLLVDSPKTAFEYRNRLMTEPTLRGWRIDFDVDMIKSTPPQR